MIQLPRFALATPSTGTEPSSAALAWLAGLTDRRWRVQHFRSRACPTGTQAVGQVTGLPGRHLDSWLMPENVLRKLFARGANGSDLALVEGTLEDHPAPLNWPNYNQPGSLRPIADALDLPIVAVLPCPGPGRDPLHLPRVPACADAIFLDELEHPDDFDFYRRMIQLTSKKPVLGAVESFPEINEALREAPRDRPISEALVGKLAESFLRFADLNAISNLARSRPFASCTEDPSPCASRQRFRVAYAQDEAFGAYFPDTLEALEALGADLVEFSPLRDDSLPDGVDLVMIGCGFPDRYADALSRNMSLKFALQSHVCGGQRIYSEGGGTAYLGRWMIIDGRQYAGVGILPFDAELLSSPPCPSPVTRILTRGSWLGPSGTVVRGYKSSRWKLISGADPLDCPSCHGSLTAQDDFYFHHHAVGGLIHLHLGALAEAVAAFAGPHSASLTLPTARPCP